MDDTAKAFLEDYCGSTATDFLLLAQSGSSRSNWVGECNGQHYIVTYNENIRENEAFFYFSGLFSSLKLCAPEIFKISEDKTLYIQQYLGEKTLADIIKSEGESPLVHALIQQSLKHLYLFQQKTQNLVDYSKSFDYESYGDLAVTHDLYYFKNFMADVLELPYHKSALLQEFKIIVEKIESLTPKALMIRDFQSRNIMVSASGDIAFIDYQAAMKGPVMYDVVSLLYQAKANFSQDFRDAMCGYFISFYPTEIQKELKDSIRWIQLVRYLQVLGAYGFRGLVQGKAHFISSIPNGVRNIATLANNWQELQQFPQLTAVIQQLTSAQTTDKINKITNQDKI